MNLLFGEGVLGAVFVVWWAFGNPPLKLIFTFGALLAGYYAWRVSYTRLLPAIQVSKVCVEETSTNHVNQKRTYVQIEPEFLSEAPIEECRGYLLRVWKRDSSTSRWESTPLNQPLELNWSYVDSPTITLQPNIGQRLNIAWIDNMMPRLLPDAVKIPFNAYSLFSVFDSFKFDVQVVGKNCTPANIGVVIENSHEWNRLKVYTV